MRSHARRTVALVASLVGAAGCGGGSAGSDLGGDGGDGGVHLPATPTEFDESLAVSFCRRGVRCGAIGASELAQCEADARAGRKMYAPAYSLEEAVAQGRVAFDPMAAAACVMGLEGAGCTVGQEVAAAHGCDGVYAPKVKAGAPCRHSLECQGGLCAGLINPGCNGTCVAFAARGASCAMQPCDDKVDFCHPTLTVCSARVGLAVKCGSDARCERGLYCMTSSGTCRAPGIAGSECEVFIAGSDTCVVGLFCDELSGMPRCAERRGAGGACGSKSLSAVNNGCQDGLGCVGFDGMTPGMCAAFGDVGKGCDPLLFRTGCPRDQWCDPAGKACAAWGQKGSDCSIAGSDGYCRDYLYCDGPSMTCQPRAVFGGACVPPVGNFADPCYAGSCEGVGKICTLVCK